MKDYPVIPEYTYELLNASNIGIDPLLQTLNSLLSHPLIITNPLHRVTFSSDLPGSLEKDTTIFIEEMKTNDDLRTITYTIQSTDYNSVGLAAPIIHLNKTYGYLILLGEDPIELYQFNKIVLFAASLCAIQMQKKEEMVQEKIKYKVAFLFDLLYGNMKQKEDIIEYGKIWGWDFNLDYQILVFSLAEFNPFSTDKQILNTLHNFIGKLLSERNRIPISMIKQSQVIVIFPLNPLEVPATAKDEIRNFSLSVIKQMKTLYPENQVACGIGKVYSNPVELFRSFQEAKVAYDLGLLLSIEIPFFSDLGLERILYKHDLQDLKEYYDNVLGNLVNYDATNDSDLMDTLEAFAANHFDITQTAKVLFLHRNTLRYRLKKIEEILNMELDDFHIKLNISAAFKIKQVQKF